MQQIVGTWRLVRATAQDAEGSVLPAPYGPKPMGRVTLAADGRMMAVLCDGRAQLPAGETRQYTSYCGNYRFEDGRLTTRVDAASDAERLGTDQVRDARFEGDLMVLRPPLRASASGMEQRELYWERIAEV
jgi:hypothetical protein